MWPWQHPPSTRSPCRGSLPPGLSAWQPPSSVSALTLRTGTAQRPYLSTTLLHVLRISDSQASRTPMPPLPAIILTVVYSAKVHGALHKHRAPCEILW